eukprot:GILJ01002431.1.p1 GENE.GILJ01002431.1~~GILJ01002431.1.p1  ORF type:complete len:209 (-),score=14.46 GILJ01002431.1:237-815(-)
MGDAWDDDPAPPLAAVGRPLERKAENTMATTRCPDTRPAVKLLKRESTSSHHAASKLQNGHRMSEQEKRSLREREAEYQRARERIFGSDGKSKAASTSPYNSDSTKDSRGFTAGRGRGASVGGKPAMDTQQRRPDSRGQVRAITKRQGDYDPDFDRNVDRYRLQFQPGFGQQVENSELASETTYESEFPPLR